MKQFLCFILITIMIVPCACAANLENVYQSDAFSVFPLPGYTLSSIADSFIYVKDNAIITLQEIPLAEYTFEDIVDSYDLLFSAFTSDSTRLAHLV